MTERTHRPPGFTLLELTLALSSLALLAAICYGAFHLSWRAVQRGEVAVVTAQRLRVASDVIIRQIKSVVAYPMRTADEDVFPYFYGTPTWMKFVTTGGLQQGGLTRVVYRLEDDPPRLILEETHDFTNDSLGAEAEGLGAPSEHSTILLDGFKGLRFSYLPKDEEATGKPEDWKDTWSPGTEEALPVAVQILVRGMPGIELDEWGQEIPIMSTVVGDNNGEVDPDGNDLPPEVGESDADGAADGETDE